MFCICMQYSNFLATLEKDRWHLSCVACKYVRFLTATVVISRGGSVYLLADFLNMDNEKQVEECLVSANKQVEDSEVRAEKIEEKVEGAIEAVLNGHNEATIAHIEAATVHADAADTHIRIAKENANKGATRTHVEAAEVHKEAVEVHIEAADEHMEAAQELAKKYPPSM